MWVTTMLTEMAMVYDTPTEPNHSASSSGEISIVSSGSPSEFDSQACEWEKCPCVSGWDHKERR